MSQGAASGFGAAGEVDAAADPEAFRALLQAHLDGSPFNVWADVRLESAEPGRVVIGIDAREDFRQAGGHLHAAIQAGVLEVALGMSVATKVGPVAVTSLTTTFIAPAIGVRFRATGEAVRAGRRQGFATAELHAELEDGSTVLVALGNAVMVPVAAAAAG